MHSVTLVKLALLAATIARGKPPMNLPKVTQSDARQPINAAKSTQSQPAMKPMGIS
jgi:hypothetical protein